MMEPNKMSADAAAQLAQTERYLEQDPDNPSLAMRAIDLALACGEFSKAERLLAAALQVRGDDPAFLFRRAELSGAQGRWLDAQAQYQELARRFDDINLLSALARAKAECQDYPGAVGVLWSRRHDADFPARAAIQLVRALHHSGRGGDAVAYARESTDRFGDEPVFLAVASLVALDEEELELAQVWSASAQRDGSAPIEALVVDATVALSRLDVDASVAGFRHVLSQRPDEARSLAGLGTANLIRRDFPEALKQLEAAHRGMPTHIGTLHLLGWCKLFIGDIAGAQQAFERALELDRNFADSHGGMAVVYALQDRRGPAEDAIKRAQGLDPASLSARFARMVLDGDTRDPARFAMLAERVLERQVVGEGMTMAGLLRKYRAS